MSQIVRVLAAFLLLGSVAERAPATVFYTGGDVTVTSLWSDAGYMSVLNLYSPSYNELSYLTTRLPGQAVTFNPANYGFKVGDELVFGIRVINTGAVYFMGAGGRNPDRLVHARVESQRAGSIVVGFEDVFGGGDLDYNDLRFLFQGGVSGERGAPGVTGLASVTGPGGETGYTWKIPEPSALALLGIGLLGAAVVRRRRLK